MFKIRKSKDRGHANHGWLEAKHSFSFSSYYDPEHMGFRVLRVINQDKVSPGMGFGQHPHNDMEIVTYVTSGALEHKDTLGTTAVIRPGEMQRMSAGTGIHHSEFNHSRTEPVTLLQIWLLPEKEGITPGYEQKSFAKQFAEPNSWVLTASRGGRDGSVVIHQDVDLYVGHFAKDHVKDISFRPGRYGWLQIVRGSLQVNDVVLEEGDGLAISEESSMKIKALAPSEFLFFDLP